MDTPIWDCHERHCVWGLADASGVYVAGSTSGTAFGPAGYGFLRKFDSSGVEIWTRQLGSELFAVTLDSTGIYAG